MRQWFRDAAFRSLLKNTGYLAVSRIVAGVAGIAVLAFAGRALGLHTFGLLIVIASYAQAANGLSKFQSWQLVLRYGGGAIDRADVETFKRAASFGFGLDLVSGVLGMGAALALLPFIGHWFGISDQNLRAAALYCLIIPTMGASTPSGVLRALNRFDLMSWQGTVKPIGRAIFSGIAFLAGWGFSEFLLIWWLTDFASDLYLWVLALREMRRRDLLSGVRPTLRPTGLERAWPFAIKVNLTSSLESAWGPLARLIVGGLLGPAAAATYRVAASLADSIQKPADLLAKAYFPEIVRMDFATKHPWRLMLRGTVFAGTIGLAVLLGLTLFGPLLIRAIFGPGFEAVYPVLLILMFVPVIAILMFPIPPMLLALDRPSAPLIARIVGTLTYLGIIYPMTRLYGISGAAWSIVIGYVLVAFMLAVQLKGQHGRVRKT